MPGQVSGSVVGELASEVVRDPLRRWAEQAE